MKGALRSRTMWFSYALIALGVVESQWSLIRDLVPERYQGLVYVCIGIIVALLRAVTTVPLDKR